jgi:hypothetical protein
MKKPQASKLVQALNAAGLPGTTEEFRQGIKIESMQVDGIIERLIEAGYSSVENEKDWYATRVSKPSSEESSIRFYDGGDHALVKVEYDDAPESKPVEKIRIGEYVKRRADSSKVYVRDYYDPETKRYCLTDAEDLNRWVWVNKGTVLFVGFPY